MKKDWQQRVEDLRQVVRDVAPVGHPPPGGTGTGRHRVLFEQYVSELTPSVRSAQEWFEGLIEVEEERTQDRAQAEEAVRGRRPVGPVADGGVIAVVRKFWLDCAAINDEVDGIRTGEAVAPEDFILTWLLQEGYEELAEFLSSLPFWPMGLDPDGHWV